MDPPGAKSVSTEPNFVWIVNDFIITPEAIRVFGIACSSIPVRLVVIWLPELINPDSHAPLQVGRR